MLTVQAVLYVGVHIFSADSATAQVAADSVSSASAITVAMQVFAIAMNSSKALV